jgi:hypothetical protein
MFYIAASPKIIALVFVMGGGDGQLSHIAKCNSSHAISCFAQLNMKDFAFTVCFCTALILIELCTLV